MGNRTFKSALRAGGVLTIAFAAAALAGERPLPRPIAPVENPSTEEKRVLGKILFFEEQLSSDNSVACATCHVMRRGGTDPRRAFGVSKSDFDPGRVFGSPGVVSMGKDGVYIRGRFGSGRQVTARATPSPFAASYAGAVLWDGAAGDRFVDPVTHDAVIAKGGALESQALLPLVNSAEMGHEGRSFAEVVAKVERAAPLALADRLPPDMQAALDGNPGYPELFRRAFGDTQVTARRIAMAIATYERTLVPDRTDYDRFLAGDETALTARERRGLAAFEKAGCVVCHVPPLFTDNTFRTTGVRPLGDDHGRSGVTSKPQETGAFKVPSLRNAALKGSFFHDGKRTALRHAIKYYRRLPGAETRKSMAADRGTTKGGGGNGTIGYGDGGSPTHEEDVQFLANQDPAMAEIQLTRRDIGDIETFLAGGLVDPRVQDEQFPFDRPTLASEHPDLQPRVVDGAVSGDGGMPTIQVTTPAFLGSEDFRVGVLDVLGVRPAVLSTSWTGGGAPTITEAITTNGLLLNGAIWSETGVTLVQAVPDVAPGTTLRLVWEVGDEWYPDPPSRSASIEVPVFAPRAALLPNGGERPPLSPAGVDDADAHVAVASFRVDWRAHQPRASRDWLRGKIHVNPSGAGADISQARLTVRVGDADVLTDAPLDARGRLHADDADASFDPATGTVAFFVRGLDLRSSLAATSGIFGGRIDVPLTVSVAGMGLVEPTVSADVAFEWRPTVGGAAVGRYGFHRSGSSGGTFQVTRVKPVMNARDRLVQTTRVSGVLAAPGGGPFRAPAGLALMIGDSLRIEVDAAQTAWSRETGRIVARPGSPDRRLVIDVRRRTFTLDIPQADLARPKGTLVPLRLRIEARPAVGAPIESYETVIEVSAL